MSHPAVKRGSDKLNSGYFQSLEGWTSSWVSLEVGSAVTIEIEVTKLYDNGIIRSAAVLPAHKGGAIVQNGKALITFSGPQQLTVDVDRMMLETDTGNSDLIPANKHVVHSFTVFANPILASHVRPSPNDPDVRTVAPGETPPETFSESMLYFLPGVHNITSVPECCTTLDMATACICVTGDQYKHLPGYVDGFSLQSGKKYYIPSDAWLNGHIVNWGLNRDFWGIDGTTLFGYGTVSGERYRWKDIDQGTPRGCQLRGMTNTHITGPMWVDFPNHNLILVGTKHAANTLQHVKILGWRTNSDGVHLWGNWNEISDLFLRTQDDSMYIGDNNGVLNWKRITTWNDANGVPFLLANGDPGVQAVLTDSDVLFHRKQYYPWCGGVINARWSRTIQDVTFRDIRVHDPFQTCPLFAINPKEGPGQGSSINKVKVENMSAVSFPPFTKLPKWFCEQSLGPNPKLRFGLPNRFGCDMPYGPPNLITGGLVDPMINISSLIINNVTINGTSMYTLMTDPLYAGASVVKGYIAVGGLVVDGIPLGNGLPFKSPGAAHDMTVH